MDQIDELVKLIKQAKRIVFFGGAGVSTESGIPDFRSVDGLYHQKYDYPPEEILSHDFFEENPEAYYRFHRDKLLNLEVKPNPAHYALAKLEAMGKLSAVITQNIDGLHQQAGNKNVIELHGSILRNYCCNCHQSYDVNYVAKSDNVPRCSKCGGVIRPDIVLYGEGLDDEVVNQALTELSNADLLIIGGTSLVVYPAASFIRYYRGNKLVLLNRDQTSMDDNCDIIIREPIGQVMSQVIEKLKI